MNRSLDVTTSFLASIARLGAGISVSDGVARKPEQMLELYEFEACPFCRKVRDGLSMMDLDAKIHPCPRGGKNREIVRARGGKTQFPYLVDANTGQAMYESDDILRYLATTYGDGGVPLSLRLGPITTASAVFASAFRPSRGRRSRPSKPAAEPLELWSFESSPYCRIVREVLCELELSYVLHNVGKGSPRRAEFIAMSGKMMVPYLKDPNTGTVMFESADIVRYLEATYAA